MRMLLLASILFCGHAVAADLVVVLDDAAQRDMILVLKQAAASQNLDMAAPVGRIWDKLKAAPILKPDAPAAPPAAPSMEKPQ